MVSKSIYPAFQTQSRAIASYNYFDIAEGTGVKVFNGAAVDVSGSQTILTSQEIDGGGFYQDNDCDYITLTHSPIEDTYTSFELTPFNTPKTINGKAYIRGTCFIHTTGTPGMTWKIQASVYKNDTELGSQYGALMTYSNKADIHDTFYTFNIPVEISRTHFKKGDILKVKIYGNTQSWGTGTGLYILHDPINRQYTTGDDTNDTTKNPSSFKVYIPFEIDI